MTAFNDQIDAILTDLSSATSEELETALGKYDTRDWLAVVAKRLAAGGGGGGSIPANTTWDEDALLVRDTDGHLVFWLRTLVSAGTRLTVRTVAYFTGSLTTYNDNGDPLLESDPLANAGAGEVRVGGVTLDPTPPTPNLAAVIAQGNAAGAAITSVTNPTNPQDAATKASAQAQAAAAEQNAKDYADSLSTGWQTGTLLQVNQGATQAVLASDPTITFYRWAVDANGIVTVHFSLALVEGTETDAAIEVLFPDLPVGTLPTFNRSGALGCQIGGVEYNLFADIAGVDPEVGIVPANIPAITTPLLAGDSLAGMFTYPT